MKNSLIITLVILGCCIMFAGVLHDRSFKAEQRADRARIEQVMISVKARNAAEDQVRQRQAQIIQNIGDRRAFEIKLEAEEDARQKRMADEWKIRTDNMRATVEADLQAAQEEGYKATGL